MDQEIVGSTPTGGIIVLDGYLHAPKEEQRYG